MSIKQNYLIAVNIVIAVMRQRRQDFDIEMVSNEGGNFGAIDNFRHFRPNSRVFDVSFVVSSCPAFH